MEELGEVGEDGWRWDPYVLRHIIDMQPYVNTPMLLAMGITCSKAVRLQFQNCSHRTRNDADPWVKGASRQRVKQQKPSPTVRRDGNAQNKQRETSCPCFPHQQPVANVLVAL